MPARPLLRAVLAILFLAAGVLHLLVPEPFVAITPDWVPFAAAVIALTGLAEIAGSVGLMIPRLRRAAGIGLALYAVCVFPANIHHALIDLARAEPQPGWAYHGPRLLLQPVIVWLCLWVAEVIEWPFRRRQAA
jgi:uncharacterized membrane protein